MLSLIDAHQILQGQHKMWKWESIKTQREHRWQVELIKSGGTICGQRVCTS